MGRRKSGKAKVVLSEEAKERESAREHIRRVNAIIDREEVNFRELRQIAAVKGLANKELRQKAWPLLLGLKTGFESDKYEKLRIGKHRDSSVVECDVQRSLWFYTQDWDSRDRDLKREALQSILTAVACNHPGNVHYYQGLHDIASVLLFNADEHLAFQMLDCMVTCHLRDCTRPTLDAVLELLQLLLPLLHEADRELHDHIAASGVPPFFALSWFITWFAHNVPDLDLISRLFDLLFASHPLMALYVSVAAMQFERKRILACPEDPSEMHHLLTSLPILPKTQAGRIAGQQTRADALAQQAVHLHKHCPPDQLLKLSGMQMQRQILPLGLTLRFLSCSATAPEAELDDNGEHFIMPQNKVISQGPQTLMWALKPKWASGRRKGVKQVTAVAFSVAWFCAVSYVAYMHRA